jgi:hypothetical protein
MRLGVFSSLLIEDQFGIFSIGFIGAHQQEIHIGGDAETAVPAKRTFQLIAQIGGPVI